MSKATHKKTGARKATAGKKRAKRPTKRWSAKVTQTSDALDLKTKVFKSKDPEKVARSLKASSDHSKRRKGTPLQSAMSMLNFYINRAGKNLPSDQKKILNDAKKELRELYGRSAKSNNKTPAKSSSSRKK